jgi:Zn-dependent protease with chaperone function
VETAAQRAKKYRKKQNVDQDAGPTYWFLSESIGHLPESFELRLGKAWSPVPILIPFAFTLFGPGLLGLWLRRRAERKGATQSAAVWVHWILNATWLYWIFSASSSNVSDLLAHFHIDNLSEAFVLGAVLMALPPLFAVATCTAILARDPEGEIQRRDTLVLVKRTVARESVLMVPFAIFLGNTGSFEQDWRLSAVALVTAYLVYRLLSWYVSRWVSRGMEILTHGELMQAAMAIAARAGVILASVYVFGNADEREVNAFAGRGGVMAMTRGLVERLTRRELTAVIGHEVGHLRGKHVAMSTIAFWAYIVLAQPLSMLLIHYAHIPWLMALPILPIVYIFAVARLSRKNEFNADARAVDLTGDPEGMIAALARLRKLTRTPVAWGGIQGSLLSHPSMRDRVLSIARHSGLPEDRALALLEDPDLLAAEVAPEALHFGLPAECAGAETVFSTNAKMTYLLWVNWAEQVSLVAICLSVGAFAERVWPGPGFAILLVFAAIPVIAAANLVFSNWIGRCFIRSVRRRLLERMGVRAEGGTFAGLLPGPLPAPVEGFYQWDTGFCWLTADALVFRGEKASFALPRASVRGVSVTRGPLSWDRAHLVRVECEGGALQLSRPDVGTMRHQARRLERRLQQWLQGSVNEVCPGTEMAPEAAVLQPASTHWMRGLAALRFHLVRAFLLLIGISMLAPLAKGVHLQVISYVVLLAPLAYMAINLPYLLRRKPLLLPVVSVGPVLPEVVLVPEVGADGADRGVDRDRDPSHGGDLLHDHGHLGSSADALSPAERSVAGD